MNELPKEYNINVENESDNKSNIINDETDSRNNHNEVRK